MEEGRGRGRGRGRARRPQGRAEAPGPELVGQRRPGDAGAAEAQPAAAAVSAGLQLIQHKYQLLLTNQHDGIML